MIAHGRAGGSEETHLRRRNRLADQARMKRASSCPMHGSWMYWKVAQQLLQVRVLDPHREGEPDHRAKDASASREGPIQVLIHGMRTRERFASHATRLWLAQ
ncbi:hypothetical protein D3C86_1118650 [compost metagenome]